MSIGNAAYTATFAVALRSLHTRNQIVARVQILVLQPYPFLLAACHLDIVTQASIDTKVH